MDKEKTPRVPLLLVLVAALPFILQFLLLAVQMTDANFTLHLAKYNDYAIRLFLMYCFILLIFLAGISWGMAIKSEVHQQVNVIYIGGIFVILSVSLLLMMVFFYRIWIFFMVALLFSFVWFIDSLAYRKNLGKAWYMRLRNITSPIMIISLLGIQIIIFFVQGL